MKNRRICILASMGWGVRNVLMSRAIDVLREQAEIHVFSTFNHVPAFRQRFAALDRLEDILDTEMRRPTKMLYRWSTYTFYKISPSVTHQHKLRKKRPKKRHRPERLISLPGRVKKIVLGSAGHFIENFSRTFGNESLYRLSRRTLSESFRYGNRYKTYKAYLRRQGIDTVISSNPLNITEYPALIAARDLGIRTVAIITSWDNLSSKRPLIIDFDDYLVWNRIMAGEVAYYYHARPEQIHEIGPLQFDFYFDRKFIDTREEFCRRHGFDPARKIVVHSTVTSQLLPDEPEVVAKLLQALKDGRMAGSPNFLVRLHPKRPFSEFRAVSQDPRWKGLRVAWTLAGTPVRDKNDLWCPLDDEMRLLTNTVRHGDVNLNVFSTMMLDFAVLGKPAVLISHNSEDKRLHYGTYEHLQPVVACKSNRIAYTFEETLKYLNDYLEHPELDAEGRAALVEMQCGRLLGQSWEHMSAAILNGRPLRPRRLHSPRG